MRLGLRSADLFDDLGAMLEQDERLEGEVRLKAAVAAYSKGLELRPTDVLLLIKRGWAWDGLGQGDKALADFQAALRQEPNNAEAHAGLGYLRAVAKLPVEAQQEAEHPAALGVPRGALGVVRSGQRQVGIDVLQRLGVVPPGQVNLGAVRVGVAEVRSLLYHQVEVRQGLIGLAAL